MATVLFQPQFARGVLTDFSKTETSVFVPLETSVIDLSPSRLDQSTESIRLFRLAGEAVKVKATKGEPDRFVPPRAAQAAATRLSLPAPESPGLIDEPSTPSAVTGSPGTDPIVSRAVSTTTTTTPRPPPPPTTTTTAPPPTTTTTAPPPTTTTTTVPPPTTTTTLPPPPSEGLGILRITGWAAPESNGEWEVVVLVEIHNYGDNQPAYRARVTGEWSGSAEDDDSEKTDRLGLADFSRDNLEGDSITFTVTEVSHHDYEYAPELNRETTITIQRPESEEETSGLIFVSRILGWSRTRNNDQWQAMVLVEVRNEQGRPVRRAQVHGTWAAGDHEDDHRDNTGRFGVASFDLDDLEVDEVTFTVTSISHDDYEYDPDLNRSTSITVRRPR